MKFYLDDISVMIASLLTIYEDGIYMPHKMTLDNKEVVFVSNEKIINNIKSLNDIDKYDECFLLYLEDKNIDGNNVFINDNNFINYPYILDFISYLTYYQVEDITDISVLLEFLNMNYFKPRKRIKL